MGSWYSAEGPQRPERKNAMSTTTVPVTITPEATARLAELGMLAELEQMLEHTRQVVPGLRKIEVNINLPYETHTDIGIGIEAYSTLAYVPGDRTHWDWGAWKVRAFPPEVCEHFSFGLMYEGSHAG
jgi:hypothetical protein